MSVMVAIANPATARVLEQLGASTLNVAPDLSLAQIAAIRAAVDYDGILALTNNTAVRGPAVYSIGLLGLTQADADRLNPKTDLAKAKELMSAAVV